MEKFFDLEYKLNANVDLLEIAKDYCEFNSDRETTLTSLISLLEIILKNQKDLIADFDKTIIREV